MDFEVVEEEEVRVSARTAASAAAYCVEAAEGEVVRAAQALDADVEVEVEVSYTSVVETFAVELQFERTVATSDS
jgi:hypothetical protein